MDNVASEELVNQLQQDGDKQQAYIPSNGVNKTKQPSVDTFFENNKSKTDQSMHIDNFAKTQTNIPSNNIAPSASAEFAFTDRDKKPPTMHTANSATITHVSKYVPSYKWIPNSSITVDAFSFGEIANCSEYFLSHYHYDHYGGLSKRFNQTDNTIFTSAITSRLIQQEIKIDTERIVELPLDVFVEVNDNVRVLCIDANQ